MAFGKCPSCELLRIELAEWKQRHDKLFEAYQTLRLNGATPATQAKITPPAMPPEERALNRAHDEFVDEAARHISTLTGVPIERAREEAEKFRREIDTPMQLP